MKDMPEGDFRSTATDALCRVRRSVVGGGFGEELARSMRRTEAPLSARRRPAKGPGARPANSRTRRPVKGGGDAIVSCLDVENKY